MLNCDIISKIFVNFWFKFVYPNISNLYMLSTEEFYDTYIENSLMHISIGIVAQSEDRRSIIGFCNWDKPMMTMDEL